VGCLRDFLLENFSLPYLRSGAILDVAGGKGDLSWQLRNADTIDSVVVDPRRTDHTKMVRTALWRHEHPKEAAEQINDAQAREGQLRPRLVLEPPFLTPRHLRVFLDDAIIAALETSGDEAAWRNFWEGATARAEADEGKKGHHQPLRDESGDGEVGRVTNAAQARELLKSARLIVGFHPDQATEPCIDLAIALRIPFVVCPCCVFPSQFSSRRLHGRSVSSYDDFLRYLLRKHPGMRMGKLKFESKAVGDGAGQARNTVLYMLPEDYLVCGACVDPSATNSSSEEGGQEKGKRKKWANWKSDKKKSNKGKQGDRIASAEHTASQLAVAVAVLAVAVVAFYALRPRR
jgi:hypothetical protein